MFGKEETLKSAYRHRCKFSLAEKGRLLKRRPFFQPPLALDGCFKAGMAN
ncbi:hypothetical protein HMPREF1705_04705 [Acetomicrobium hydrogeniformans ATCC BAA-1850]|uniref:Uncharacterized protein n=1 Tax=Acetomicrobium hydrogeniformans ATCC BAA-1850 TaxID=592015 RepID=A0A0T5XE52_9BACT|nr:hypothetical protein HMPREF1705_04705 [Acetomicrobium hydrogeniformans ATCC BAA-1850]